MQKMNILIVKLEAVLFKKGHLALIIDNSIKKWFNNDKMFS